MTATKTLTNADLAQFTGSETWYRHALVRKVLFTDGAKFVADRGGAYWLLDEIALAQQFEAKIASEPFQLWKLTVDLDKCTATLTCENGDCREIYRNAIPFTDFPLGEVKFYCINNTILLPSEY